MKMQGKQSILSSQFIFELVPGEPQTFKWDLKVIFKSMKTVYIHSK